MRFADVLLAIPSLLLSLALVTVLGFGTVNVAIAVGLASVASVARIMRSEVVRVRSSVYVEAAQASGSRWHRVLLQHVLPNSAGPAWSSRPSSSAPRSSPSRPSASWGTGHRPRPRVGHAVSTGRDFLRNAWWLTTLPGSRSC